jgi:hypothetical protein
MAELTDRELRQIKLCTQLSAAFNAKTFFSLRRDEIIQVLEDIRGIARERNQLEDEVLALSLLVLGEPK